MPPNALPAYALPLFGTFSVASCYDMSTTLTGVDLTVAHTWDVVCTIPNNSSNSITCDYAKKVG